MELEKYPKSPFSMNKKISMYFSKKVLGTKSDSLEVLHCLLKFREHRFLKDFFSRSRVGPFNHSDVVLLTLELNIAEIGVFFQFSRRTSVSVY